MTVQFSGCPLGSLSLFIFKETVSGNKSREQEHAKTVIVINIL